MLTKIKLLYLATGDEYCDVVYNGDIESLVYDLAKQQFISITVNGKSIYINSEFVVSFELA